MYRVRSLLPAQNAPQAFRDRGFYPSASACRSGCAYIVGASCRRCSCRSAGTLHIIGSCPGDRYACLRLCPHRLPAGSTSVRHRCSAGTAHPPGYFNRTALYSLWGRTGVAHPADRFRSGSLAGSSQPQASGEVDRAPSAVTERHQPRRGNTGRRHGSRYAHAPAGCGRNCPLGVIGCCSVCRRCGGSPPFLRSCLAVCNDPAQHG